MNSSRYRRIAVGLVFIAITLKVDGVEVFLPTFIGYALVALGCFQLRRSDSLFWVGAVAGAVLTVWSLSGFLRDAAGSPSSTVLSASSELYGDLHLALHVAMATTLALGIRRHSHYRRQRKLSLRAGTIAWLVILLETPRLFMSHPSYGLLIVFLLTTTTYMGALLWLSLLAAKKLP